MNQPTAGSKVSINKSTSQNAGSCFDCEARMGEDYPVFQIIIRTPGGINNELRYCFDHLPDLFYGFVEILAEFLNQTPETAGNLAVEFASELLDSCVPYDPNACPLCKG